MTKMITWPEGNKVGEVFAQNLYHRFILCSNGVETKEKIKTIFTISNQHLNYFVLNIYLTLWERSLQPKTSLP